MNPLFKGQQNGKQKYVQPAQTPNVNMQSLADTINFAKSFQSPQAFWEQLNKNNPQAAKYLSELAQKIQNPQQYAMDMLNKQGINPRQLMQMLNGQS